MKKMKKMENIILSLLIVFAFTNNTMAANIIYAPTKTPVESNANNKIIDEENNEPSSTISLITMNSDNARADYMTVYNIYENDGNYYSSDNATNAWRKIAKLSFAEFAPVDNFPNDYIWAYFQSNGKAIRANTGAIKKTKIDNVTYAFNEYGELLTGYFNDRGDMWNEYTSTEEDPFDLLSDTDYLYYANENDGALFSGWKKLMSNTSRYENKNSIWLYFSPTNFRSVRSTSNNYKSQNIDGKTYAFDDNGVMLVGFEAMQYNRDHGGNTSKNVYFGQDGAEVKSGFVNVDMDDELNYEIYNNDDDTDITIYLNKNGTLYYNTIKKIGSAYYGFDDKGALVKGLSLWNGTNYVATIDTEETNGRNYILYGTCMTKNNGSMQINNLTVHYFDNNGKRKTSGTKLEFADDIYNYYASNAGAHNGIYDKKFYSHGILLKPTNDCKYGIYVNGGTGQTFNMDSLIGNPNVYVVNSSGATTHSTSGLKDNDDNYFLTSSSGTFMGVYSVPVKMQSGTYYYKSTDTSGKETFIPFGTHDKYGKTQVNYRVRLDSGALLNFNLS